MSLQSTVFLKLVMEVCPFVWSPEKVVITITLTRVGGQSVCRRFNIRANALVEPVFVRTSRRADAIRVNLRVADECVCVKIFVDVDWICDFYFQRQHIG